MVSVDLAALTPHARMVWLEAWSAGYAEGHAAGRRDHQAELQDAWGVAPRNLDDDLAWARHLANTPTYAELCDRRGHPERAERARTVLRERGIWPAGLAS